MASLKTFYRGKEPNRPLSQFFDQMPWYFSVGFRWSVSRLKGWSDERRSVALPPLNDPQSSWHSFLSSLSTLGIYCISFYLSIILDSSPGFSPRLYNSACHSVCINNGYSFLSIFSILYYCISFYLSIILDISPCFSARLYNPAGHGICIYDGYSFQSIFSILYFCISFYLSILLDSSPCFSPRLYNPTGHGVCINDWYPKISEHV